MESKDRQSRRLSHINNGVDNTHAGYERSEERQRSRRPPRQGGRSKGVDSGESPEQQSLKRPALLQKKNSSISSDNDVDDDSEDESQTAYERTYAPHRWKMPEQIVATNKHEIYTNQSFTKRTKQGVCLQWTDPAKGPNLCFADLDARSERAPPYYIRWVHLESDALNFEALKEAINIDAYINVTDREERLTKRLLDRVTHDHERQYPAGWFCRPSAFVYKSRDFKKQTLDRTSSFLNFPYFFVAEARPITSSHARLRDHPVRTLMQSRYRREKTALRDQVQCIKTLKPDDLLHCITRPMPTTRNAEDNVDEIVHVAQMWCVAIGNDKLITYGVTSQRDICHSTFVPQGTKITSHTSPSIVRIHVIDDERPQDAAFAIQECHSYFGLTNRVDQVVQSLDIKKPDRGEYRLFADRETTDEVEDIKWASLLLDARSRKWHTLHLWLRDVNTPLPVPCISITGDPAASARPSEHRRDSTVDSSGSHAEFGDSPGISDELMPYIQTRSASPRPSQYPESLPVPGGSLGIQTAETTSATAGRTEIVQDDEHVRGRPHSPDQPKSGQPSKSNSRTTDNHAARRASRASSSQQQTARPDRKKALTKNDIRNKMRESRSVQHVPSLLAWPIVDEDGQEEQKLVIDRLVGIFQGLLAPVTAERTGMDVGDSRVILKQWQDLIASQDARGGVGTRMLLASQRDTAWLADNIIPGKGHVVNSNDLRADNEGVSAPGTSKDPKPKSISHTSGRPIFAVGQQAVTGQKLIANQGDQKTEVDESKVPILQVPDDFAPERRSLYDACCELWDIFVPLKYPEEQTAVRMYWGAVSTIISNLPFYSRSSQSPDDLTRFDEDFDLMEAEIVRVARYANKYRLGVFCEQLTDEAKSQKDDFGFHRRLDRGAFLMDVTVDAFAAILSMLQAAARHMKDQYSPGGIRDQDSQFRRHATHACELLNSAAMRTIADLNRTISSDELSTVVTPESVLLKVLDRLINGVLGSSDIDVIKIYDLRLQKLIQHARKRTSRPSRRLLTKIDDYKEQISIVHETIQQQREVLQTLRKNLNPTSYTTWTVNRTINFGLEKEILKQISKKLKAQEADCVELQTKAQQLSITQSQMVDAFQDDNNLAITAFTIITIIFLPLSFVAGFYGMNFTDFPTAGAIFNGKPVSASPRQFWKVAAPTTCCIVVGCVCLVFWRDVRKLLRFLKSVVRSAIDACYKWLKAQEHKLERRNGNRKARKEANQDAERAVGQAN